jgi:hypothetical protein
MTRRSTRTRQRAAAALAARAAAPERAAEATPGDDALAALRLTIRLLDDAIDALLLVQAHLELVQRDGTPDEQADAGHALLDVQRDLALLRARRREVLEDTATLRPPSPDMIDAAEARAQALAEAIATNARVAAILGLVADVTRLADELAAA